MILDRYFVGLAAAALLMHGGLLAQDVASDDAQPAQSASDRTVSPLLAFTRAADVGDTAKLASLMDRKSGVSSRELIEKLEGCYLRRVYSTDSSKILAAWMCTESGDKSRVLIAELEADEEDVTVTILREDRDNRPAPPREGSALAE